MRRLDEVLVAAEGEAVVALAVRDGRIDDRLGQPLDGRLAPGAIHRARIGRHARDLGACFVTLADGAPGLLDTGKDPPREGDTPLVRVVEAARAGKAARVSTRLGLAGRYVVLRPGGRGVAVSARLADAHAAAALKRAVAPPAGMGAMLRSAAVLGGPEACARETSALAALWVETLRRAPAGAPALIRAEDPAYAVLSEFGALADAFVFADRHLARAARDLARRVFPDLEAKIALADEGAALFDRHGAAEALAALDHPAVPLPGGGRIVVQPTEAAVAIDVDSAGRRALAVDLEAAEEIARQLRLRDLGGLIVVDFVRLDGRGATARLAARLDAALALDRVACRALGWTHGGLFEIVRPRIRAAETGW